MCLAIFFGFSQVSHLKDLVKESETNLDTAENHISCLKDSQEKFLMELDATRARVRETSNLLTDLQVKCSSVFAPFIINSMHFESVSHSDRKIEEAFRDVDIKCSSSFTLLEV